MLDRQWLYGIIGFAGITVIATGIGLYITVASRVDPGPTAGAPPAGTIMQAMPTTTAPSAPAVPSIEIVAERLATRLKTKDGTGEDWALLARSYVQMQRYAEAVDAFGKALQKMPGNLAFIEERAAARKATGGAAPSK